MGKKDKNTKKGEKEGGGGDDMKRGQKLQAVLLAVSFTKYFRPLSYVKPKVLLPLVNVPMLMYTIEFLAQNGVEEIFIFCVRHVEMIQEFIDNLSLPSNISIRCIFSRSCLSQGDALRELDSMGIIRSDPFILIQGDIISNINLKKAILFHKSKRREDPNCIMTIIFKQIQKNSTIRSLMTDLIIGYDRHTQQLRLFDNQIMKKNVNIPLEIFDNHSSLRIRSDLLDCQIDICSPELLLQFSDNFDYQDIRQHFIKNEVVNWELGEHIYSYVIQNEYAAQISDLRTYHYVCNDIINRRVYPFVPDGRMMGTDYVQGKYYVYKESGVKIARSARIGHGVVFGKGTIVEDDAEIHNATIGRNCVIGRGARVMESHIFNDVLLEPGSSVISSIIGENSVVKSGSSVSRGCVLSSGVVVGANISLAPFTRVGSCRHPDEELSEGEEEDDNDEPGCKQKGIMEFDTKVLGVDGVGYIWKYGDEVGEEFGLGDIDDGDYLKNSESSHLLPGGQDAAFRATSMGCVVEEKWKRTLWVTPDEVKDEDSEEEDDEPETNFETVISEMVSTGYAEGHPTDSIALEIKSYKFAQNKEFADCIRGVVPGLLTLVIKEQSLPTGIIPTPKLINGLKEMFVHGMWGETLLRHFLQEQTDRIALIESVEEFAIKEGERKQIYSVFRFLLQIAYDADILTEEALLKWADERIEEFDDSPRKTLFNERNVQEFVVWLRESADEESGDEEDDDYED